MLPRSLRPLLLLLLTGLLLAPGAAQAHDRLTGTDPEDGAVLEEGPDELTLTFSGEVAAVGVQVAVTDGPGGQHLVGEPVVDGRDVVQELADLPRGDYQVAWRVTSSDGHPISGTLGFTVAGGTDASTSGTADDDAGGDTVAGATPDDGEDTLAGATPDDGEDTGATDDGATDTAADVPVPDRTPEEGSALPLPVLPAIALVVVLLGVLAVLARTWARGRRG